MLAGHSDPGDLARNTDYRLSIVPRPEMSSLKKREHVIHGVDSVDSAENQTASEDADPGFKNELGLQYTIEDTPPWYLSILLGFQHYLTMFGSTLNIPYFVAPAMCVAGDSLVMSELLGTILFVSGICTLLQATIGCRLPIVQGGTVAYLVPTFAILSLEKWKCPPIVQFDGTNSSASNLSWEYYKMNNISVMPPIQTPEHTQVWQIRMREIQGAIMLASLVQVVVGASGVLSVLLKYIGPLAIAPTIALIGISLFSVAAEFCAKQWYIALMTIALVCIFSQYLRNVDIPCIGISCKKKSGVTVRRGVQFPLFKLFPIILSILSAWLVCAIVTWAGGFPDQPGEWGYEARSDTKVESIGQASWFRIPYPFQWGLPTFSTSGVTGMIAGVLAGMVESVGDYYACARLSGAKKPPIHAINRGIFVEGIGCVLSGMWGSGNGTTSYSENIGAIGITKVGSRRVIQYGALFMLLFGCLGKFAAIFISVPEPVMGGIFLIMFGMVAAVGISNLQFVDLNSSRNLFIFGFSIVFGLALPDWVNKNKEAISTGSEIADQIFQVILGTSMFVGGAVGFFLDNTIPGTQKERGLADWNQAGADNNEGVPDETYDFPLGMDLIRKWNWTKYLPICPTYTGSCGSGCCGDKDGDEDTPVTVVYNSREGESKRGRENNTRV